MQLTDTIPTLIVSTIFCLWSAYYSWRRQRDRLLRERVVLLLWKLAEGTE